MEASIDGPGSAVGVTWSSGLGTAPSRHPIIVLNGRYELVEPLGHGGMGVVYRAIDRQNPDRPLAIKRIRTDSVGETSLALFKAEFKAMAEMRHPNVASVYDFERIHGSDDHLFTMEYVDGANALDATREASPDAILDIVVQTCRALSYIHSRKLIHLDLKPANIAVDRAGTVRVLDFGLVGARSNDRSTPYVGTPAYLAPELISAERNIDHRADLYSLGVTWFELLCRRLPFRAANVMELLKLQQTATLRFDDAVRERIPEWTRRIIERLCAKHPADRFRSGNAVIEAINAAGNHSFEVETSATRDSYFFAGRLVGRQQQLDALSSFMDERLGDGRAPLEPVLVVAGPSGGGKSRLMLELRRRAQLSHHTFVEADCYEGSFSEYEPIVAALGYVVRLAESLEATDLLDRFASALSLLDPRFDRGGAMSAAVVDNPDAGRVAMISQIGEFMVAVAERSPFALYVNDLQWARTGTLNMLANLSRLIAVRERGGTRVRLAVFGSYRDDEVDGRPIEQWLRTLRDNHELRSVRVEPLERTEVAALVGSMLGIGELPDGFVDRITRETAGNPFFISEVMRSLVEHGSIYLEHGHWKADRPIGFLEIPAMTTLFERRLAQLDHRERDVLELIAAYGRPIPLSLIGTVAKLDEDGVHTIVLGLVRRQMIARGPIANQTCCWPIHDRIRELAYAQTDRETRLSLHRALAEALEARAAQDGSAPLDELARQWWAAKDRTKALDYCMRGGAEAKRRHALETGIELLGHALDLLGEGDAQRVRVEEDLAEMLALIGDFERASAIYDRVLPKLGSPVDRARVLKQLGSIAFHRGDTKIAVENIWRALSILGEHRPRWPAARVASVAMAAIRHFLLRFIPALRRPRGDKAKTATIADCYSALVYPDFFSDPIEAQLVVLRCANHAMLLGDGPQLSIAYSHLSFAFYGLVLSRFDTATELTRRALAIADARELPLHRAHAFQAAMFVQFLEGNWDAVRDNALQASAQFRAHGDMYCVGSSYCLLLLNYQARGALGAARQAAQEGLEILERVGALAVSTPISMKYGMLLVDLGNDEAGLSRVHDAYQTAERIGDSLQRAWVRLFLGHAYFARHELDTAIKYLEECVDVRKRFKLEPDFLSNRADSLLARAYIDVARQMSDAAKKQELLDRARRHASEGMRLMRIRSTYRAAALLALAESRWEDGKVSEARALFDQAIAFADQQGSRMMLADAHYELGRRLANAAEARQHLQTALDLYDGCDAVPYVQRTRRTLACIRREN